MSMLHMGHKVPKGFKEMTGSTRIGGGIWSLPMEPVKPTAKENATVAVKKTDGKK